MNIIIIFFVILAMIILYSTCDTYENLTPTEALESISTMYNKNALTATNLNVSGNSTLGTIKAETSTIPTINSTTITNARTLTSDIGNFTTSNVTSKITTKDIDISGSLNPIGGTKAVIIETSWNQADFIQNATPYFKQSMPDGTLINFLFVSPSTQAPVNMRLCSLVKMGNQIFMFNISPDHSNFGTFTSLSNDLTWRGNVTSS